MCFFVVKLKFMVISCEKMHMISILVRYGYIALEWIPYAYHMRIALVRTKMNLILLYGSSVVVVLYDYILKYLSLLERGYTTTG